MPRVKGREDDEGAATSLYGVYPSVVMNIEDPEKRSTGLTVTFLPNAVLCSGALIGAVVALF